MNVTQNPSLRVSIIIPTLNEAGNIAQTLQCILNNAVPRSEMEVLLVDGGSQDGTIQEALRFSDSLQLRVIFAGGSSVYKALNIGLAAARGRYFVRVDARSFIPNNYIEKCLLGLQMHDVECVGGIQLQFGESEISDSIARVTSSVIGTGGAKFRTSRVSGFVDSVYLGVYRTAKLRELGGFEDESDFVSEDALINDRIRARGGKVYLDATLIVHYPAKRSFGALTKQYLIYGAAKAYVARKYRKVTSGRQIIPLVFIVCWLVLLLSTVIGWFSWIPISSALSAYMLLVVTANLEFDSFDGQRAGNICARSIATICIHFAWPIGFFLFLISPHIHRRLLRLL